MANRWGNNGNSDRLYFLSVIKSPQMVIAAMKLKTLAPWKKIMTNLDSILKSRDITLPTKAHLVKAMVSPVVMYEWELDYNESWVPKNWCSWTVVLENTLEIPLDCKEIKPVNSKGNQSWIFIGRTDAEAHFGHLIRRTDSLEKTLMLGKNEGRRRRGWQEDEMAGWHHRLDGHESEQAAGVGDGQRGLACYSPWGRKESDMTEQLNWTVSKGKRRMWYLQNLMQLTVM